MKFHSFLIKYGEIGIKGKNRYIFEDALVRQIRYALQGADGEFLVHKCHGRVYVDCEGEYDFEETVESLKKVFGIVGICPVVRVPVAELEQLKKDVVSYVDQVYEDKNLTFKVEARRANKRYPVNSMEINCAVGEAVLEAFPETKVDVHDPDVRLNVEIREEVYIYSKIIPGPGGMPIGTNGSAMLLLSGGIDSPVAGYMIAKRGVEIEATYFHAPPYTSERAKAVTFASTFEASALIIRSWAATVSTPQNAANSSRIVFFIIAGNVYSANITFFSKLSYYLCQDI